MCITASYLGHLLTLVMNSYIITRMLFVGPTLVIIKSDYVLSICFPFSKKAKINLELI